MMGEAVEQGGGHLGVAEHACPLAEAQVCCDDDAGALIEFAQQMKEKGSSGRAEGQVAELVQDQEIRSDEPIRELAGFAVRLFLFERVDGLDGSQIGATLVGNLSCDVVCRVPSGAVVDQDGWAPVATLSAIPFAGQFGRSGRWCRLRTNGFALRASRFETPAWTHLALKHFRN